MDLALFDFDGTLTTRETFPDFMRYAVARPRLIAGGVLLAPVVFGYRRGWVGGNPTRASIVQVGLRGVDAARLRAQGEAFAREVLPGVLRPEAMARLAWHRDRGDRVVVVSGGLDARDSSAALGFANATKDLQQVTSTGGELYVFALP